MHTFHFDPVRREQIVTIPGYHIWCGSMARTPDGTCHLFLSMWEEKWGFDHGWATHSKIGYAVSDTPDGAYTFRGIVLEGSGIVDGWDRDSVHNPYILWHEGVFHLYYSGNYGDGTYASHIASQRVGVAYTTDPTAGFTRLDHPILPPRAGRFDADGTTNPSVCQLEDGRFLMIYKCWAYCGETKRVAIGAAFSDDPLGMWERMDEPIFYRGWRTVCRGGSVRIPRGRTSVLPLKGYGNVLRQGKRACAHPVCIRRRDFVDGGFSSLIPLPYPVLRGLWGSHDPSAGTTVPVSRKRHAACVLLRDPAAGNRGTRVQCAYEYHRN